MARADALSQVSLPYEPDDGRLPSSKLKPLSPFCLLNVLEETEGLPHSKGPRNLKRSEGMSLGS